jgi:hypothetical protein
MAYLTIEYDEKLEVSRVLGPDGKGVTGPVPLLGNGIGPGKVDMITVSEIVEWTDGNGRRMLCVHHRCRVYCCPV